MRFEVHRLKRGASFATQYRGDVRRAFDSIVIDTKANRPAERELAVAPYDVAIGFAAMLNELQINDDA